MSQISQKTEIVLPEHKILSLSILPDAELAESQDGVYTNLCVVNKLPCVSTFILLGGLS